MTGVMMRRVACAVVAALALGGAGALGASALARVQTAERPPAGRVDFQVAWARFRAAVLADDMGGVAELTAFPLVVHGVTDDETTRVGRAGFAATFRKMLRQRPDGAGSPSNLDRIRTTPRVTDPGAGHVAPVGAVEFGRTPAGPRVVRIYVDED